MVSHAATSLHSTAPASTDEHVSTTDSSLHASLCDMYCENELAILDRKMATYLALRAVDRDVLSDIPTRMHSLAKAVDVNGKFLNALSEHGAMFLLRNLSENNNNNHHHHPPISNGHDLNNSNTNNASGENSQTSKRMSNSVTNNHKSSRNNTAPMSHNMDIEEVRKLFLLLARDWSEFGEQFRDNCYRPLVNAVEDAYREASRVVRSMHRARFRVLVPNAALGRLPWELVSRGFSVEGCESSLTSILASNYFLNHAAEEETWQIHPFIHQHSNVRNAREQARAVNIPDVSPKTLQIESDFSMRTGNFVDIYDGHDNSWDAVVSCFAFDLEEHIVPVVRRVSHILKPGGVWIYLGPLPCPSQSDLFSVQLSMDEFLTLVKRSGFRVVRQEKRKCSLSSKNPGSLKQGTVESTLFVAMKVRPSR